MTDKTAFTDEEWHAITDAPLLVTVAIFAGGEHGPISMVKEAAASAWAIANPGDHGVANGLIHQIAAAADTKEARHDMKAHRGATSTRRSRARSATSSRPLRPSAPTSRPSRRPKSAAGSSTSRRRWPRRRRR